MKNAKRQRTAEMRELTAEEIEQVAGGADPVTTAILITAGIITIANAAYQFYTGFVHHNGEE